ncbi:hypothetical protein [Verrucomicrobium spinosum]|uniref:hypothetical protein n=1 Tax=Verrucomicrobium spinosum TaxID=2736 RepID=UPI0001746AAE|nr:hypothetical protein [Verrucomicrobium spinosum]
MPTLLESVTVNRLGGEPCPEDLRVLLTVGNDLLHDLNVEVCGDATWQPWADKSYLTAADLADPDISANVRAIDDTFELINFIARTEDDTYIGYWRGPNHVPLAKSPLVSYDTEGQFRLCGGTFVESLFFVIHDDEALAQFREDCVQLGIELAFESVDDISIPSVDPTPDAFHTARYHMHKIG